MFEIVIYGRGGQGNVTAAEILAAAAFEDGLYCQAYPFFGSERMGSPVQAYVRLNREPIRLRTQIKSADVLIIQDETLVGNGAGAPVVKPTGMIIANSRKRRGELALPVEVWTVPALQIAQELIGRPSVNVVMLGAFAAATGVVSLGAIEQAARRRFPGPVGEHNCEAARRAYQIVAEQRKGL